MTNVVMHPYHELKAEAEREAAVADSPEGRALTKAIMDAMLAYSEFLDHNGVIWEDGCDPEEPDWSRLKVEALVATIDYGLDAGSSVEVKLKDGACDRVYGNGVNPDPNGLGPSDIPHKHRGDVT